MIIDEIGTVEISDIGHHFANRFNGLCEDSMTLSSGTKPLADAWSTRMVLTTRRFDESRVTKPLFQKRSEWRGIYYYIKIVPDQDSGSQMA